MPIPNEYTRYGLSAGFHAARDERRELRQQEEDRTIKQMKDSLEIRTKVLDIEQKKRQAQLDKEFGQREREAKIGTVEQDVASKKLDRQLAKAEEARAATKFPQEQERLDAEIGVLKQRKQSAAAAQRRASAQAERDAELFKSQGATRKLAEEQSKALLGQVQGEAENRRQEIVNTRQQLAIQANDQQFAQVHQILTLGMQSEERFQQLMSNPQTRAVLESVGIESYDVFQMSDILTEISNSRLGSLEAKQAASIAQAKGEVDRQNAMMKHGEIAQFEYMQQLPPHQKAEFKRMVDASRKKGGEKNWATKAKMWGDRAQSDVVGRLGQLDEAVMQRFLDEEDAFQDQLKAVASSVTIKLMRYPPEQREEMYEVILKDQLGDWAWTLKPDTRGAITKLFGIGEEPAVEAEYLQQGPQVSQTGEYVLEGGEGLEQLPSPEMVEEADQFLEEDIVDL